MPRRHLLLAVAVAVFWGVNFVIIDVGLESFPPLLFAALRFAFVAVPAVFFVPRPRIPWRYVVGVGLFLSGGQFALLFSGMHAGMPAGLASVVVQLQALFTMVLAVGLLGERPNRRQVTGAAIALGGMALIAAGRAGHGVPVGAFVLCVGAAASWGVGNVLTRKAQAPGGLGLVVWSSLVAPLPLLALSFALEGGSRIGDAMTSASGSSILALLYVVVVATGFGYGSWTFLLKRHPASRVSPFALLVPPVGIVTAWVAQGERPSAIELIGTVVVLAGLALLSFAIRMPARRPPAERALADTPA